MSWKHIRNSVAITVLVWPGAALIISPVLGLLTMGLLSLPFPDLSFNGFLAVCFCLSVGLSAYVFGYLSTLKQAVLHGVLSAMIALPIAALSTFLVLSVINFYLFLPSDWWLVRRFERNEAVFNELRDAVQGENGLRLISLERTEPANFEAFGVSLEQLEFYRTMMKQLGLNTVYRSGASESIYLSLDKLSPNTLKDYVYRQTPPPPEQIVEKIVEDEVTGSAGVYRQIGDDWYLYAEPISN